MNYREMFYSGEYGWVVHDRKIHVLAVWYYNPKRRQCFFKKYEQHCTGGEYLLMYEEPSFTDDFYYLIDQRGSGALEPVFDQGIPAILYHLSKRVSR